MALLWDFRKILLNYFTSTIIVNVIVTIILVVLMYVATRDNLIPFSKRLLKQFSRPVVNIFVRSKIYVFLFVKHNQKRQIFATYFYAYVPTAFIADLITLLKCNLQPFLILL